MAKILSKIRYLLILPILIIMFPFTITNVLAATIRTDNSFRFVDIYTSDTIPTNYTKLFDFNRNNSYIAYIYKSNSGLNYNYIKFTDNETNDTFVFIFTNSTNSILDINYDTSINNFTDFNCLPYNTCNYSQEGYIYHFYSDSITTNAQCKDYFNNNYSFGLTSPYSWNNASSISNNRFYYIDDYSGYNSIGFTNLINSIKNYTIEMPENATFSIDNEQIYPLIEPEEPEEPKPEEPTEENNLNKVYVPNYREGQCIEVLDKDTLRVFENENSSNYVDYFVNSHYLSKQGQVELDYEKNCSSLEFTSIGYYRNDFPQILFMIGSLSLFSISFIFILFKRFRKR